MDSSQPSFYHVKDPLQNLNIEVTLKKVQGYTKKKQPADGDDNSDDKFDDNEFDNNDNKKKQVSGHSTVKNVRWQKKSFGPREIAEYCPGDEDRKSLQTPRLFKSTGSGIKESDYKDTFTEMVKDGKEPLDLIQEDMIFTYVDKDGYVPKSGLQPKLTTSKGMETAVHQNPLGLAHSSMPLMHNAKEALPKVATAIQSRIKRESPFKVMYIMAAVDCDVKRMRDGAKTKNEDDIYGGGKSLGGARFYEKVLCTIKLYTNGTMQATPGFSEEEPEEEETKTFASSHALTVREKDGAKLTTFRFTTPRGSVYEYALENKNSVDCITSERMAAEQSEKDRKKVEERRNRQGEFFFGAPISDDVPFFLHSYVEIVSASGFSDDGGLLYAEYEVDKPKGWTGVNQCPGINWGGVEPIDNQDRGTTQLSRPIYLKPKISTKKEGVQMAGYKQFGTSSAPRGDHFVEGEVGRFLGVVLFITVICGLLLGEEYLFWLFSALMLFAMIIGVSPSGQYDHVIAEPVYHFGYPVSFHFAPPSDYFSDPVAQSQQPMMLFQVSSKHNFQRHIIEGYGYVKVPTKPGSYDFTVNTWVPVGGISSEVRNFFIGGAYKLHSLKSVVMSGKSGGSFLSKFGFRTVKSGQLRIRMQVVAHKQPLAVTEEGSENSGEKTGGVDNRGSIDDILTRVRKARGERGTGTKEPTSPLRRRSEMLERSASGSLRDLNTTASSTLNMTKTIDSESTGFGGEHMTGYERTGDVLLRVKARREAREKAKEGKSLKEGGGRARKERDV